MPLARLIEHLYDQPWADTIVGWDVDPQVFAGKTAVRDAERRAIETERPFFNVEWNGGNPNRIPPPTAIRQRRARDAAKRGAAGWVHPDDRGGATRAPGPARTRQVTRRRWSSRRKHLTGLAVAWPLATIAAWTGLAAHQLMEAWQGQAVTALAGSLGAGCVGVGGCARPTSGLA